MINLSGKLSHVMKNGSITATLMPRNNGSVHDHLQKSLLRNRSDRKAVFCVWWNFEGVVHWEFVPNGRAVNADLYFQQLERVHEILRRRYPALDNRNEIPLAA